MMRIDWPAMRDACLIVLGPIFLVAIAIAIMIGSVQLFGSAGMFIFWLVMAVIGGIVLVYNNIKAF